MAQGGGPDRTRRQELSDAPLDHLSDVMAGPREGGPGTHNYNSAFAEFTRRQTVDPPDLTATGNESLVQAEDHVDQNIDHDRRQAGPTARPLTGSAAATTGRGRSRPSAARRRTVRRHGRCTSGAAPGTRSAPRRCRGRSRTESAQSLVAGGGRRSFGSSSHETRRWREMDSNFRFRAR
jgi:hypothetical protein